MTTIGRDALNAIVCWCREKLPHGLTRTEIIIRVAIAMIIFTAFVPACTDRPAQQKIMMRDLPIESDETKKDPEPYRAEILAMYPADFLVWLHADCPGDYCHVGNMTSGDIFLLYVYWHENYEKNKTGALDIDSNRRCERGVCRLF